MRNQLMIELQAELQNRGITIDEQVKGALILVLAQYDVSKRSTEVMVYEGDRTEYMIKKFIMSKMVAGRSERTCKYYKQEITRFFETINKDYDKITPDDVRYYFALKLKHGWTTRTVNNARRCLSSFYTWLQLEEIISKNPMNKVELLKENKTKKEAFTDLEVEVLRDELSDERQRAMFETLLSTGCRVSELVGMRTDELEGNKIIVHGKGGKDRPVYLNARAQFALEKYLSLRNDESPWLFPASFLSGQNAANTSKRCPRTTWWKDKKYVSVEDHVNTSTVESKIRNAGRKHGIKAHPHKFRRTCATNALKKGMPIEQVSKMLGHEQLSTTQIYLDLDDSELERLHQKLV